MLSNAFWGGGCESFHLLSVIDPQQKKQRNRYKKGRTNAVKQHHQASKEKQIRNSGESAGFVKSVTSQIFWSFFPFPGETEKKRRKVV
jgi:hypothetical protein